MFSWERFKRLYSYGWKLLVSSLVETIWTQLRQLIIGKKYSANDLAFYNKGQEYPVLATSSINASIDSVLFPVMSQSQESREQVRKITRKAIQVESYILWPMMLGLAACSESFICVLLTDKWLPAAFYLRVFCITYAFYPIHIANLNALKAMGRSDLYMKLEFIKKFVGIFLLLVSMRISVKAMAYSMLISSIASQIINSWPNRKLLKYGYIDQLKDILPSAVLSFVMTMIVYCINYLHLAVFIKLFLQIIVGICIYIMGSKRLHIEGFDYTLSIIQEFLRKKTTK